MREQQWPWPVWNFAPFGKGITDVQAASATAMWGMGSRGRQGASLCRPGVAMPHLTSSHSYSFIINHLSFVLVLHLDNML